MRALPERVVACEKGFGRRAFRRQGSTHLDRPPDPPSRRYQTPAQRLVEVERVERHIELSLTELLHEVDVEIGKSAGDVEKGTQGAEGRMAQAEQRHAELMARRDRRRQELQQQRSLTLQGIERITSVLVLPHPAREAPDVRNLRSNPETEAIAMQTVMDFEQSEGRQAYDVSEKNLGYDITSLDLTSSELRLIEVKGIGGESGTILLTPNEHRVAQDRRDCYWLSIAKSCDTSPTVIRVKDPAKLPWGEVVKVQHYALTLRDLPKHEP